jgi:hypothetical protein
MLSAAKNCPVKDSNVHTLIFDVTDTDEAVLPYCVGHFGLRNGNANVGCNILHDIIY